MAVPEPVLNAPELPEAELLRETNRLRDYSDAFIRGEIDADQYTELTTAELKRRSPNAPVAAAEAPTMRVVEPVIWPQPLVK